MHKHKARMTDRRYKILILIAKGYKNEDIAQEMELSLCNTKLQKWRLYCYLGVHSAIDAVFVGIQNGLIAIEETSEKMKGVIYAEKTNS